MSGKKRALVGVDARMSTHLAALEARLNSVQTDYQAVEARIAAHRAEEESQARAAAAARQQALHEAMTGVEDRFRRLEVQTATVLAEQEVRRTRQVGRMEAGLDQASSMLASLAYEMECQRSAAQNVWRSAQETLEAAKALEEGLCAYYPSTLWQGIQPRIHAWLEESEASLYRGQDEAALLAAQQAYLDLQELRLHMEALFQRQHRLRLTAIQRLNEVLVLAESNASVQAIDYEGNFLNTWIDVNQWSGGLLGRVHARTSALLQQITGPAARAANPDWNELLEEQIPRLEVAVCDAVRQARQAVLATQLRFNIAESVVAALAGQGYTLVHSGWQSPDAQSCQVSLRDYSGSQVSVSVSPTPSVSSAGESGQTFQLDIDYHSQEALSEHILHRSVEEIYAALRSAGLEVAALPIPTAQGPARDLLSTGLAVRRAQPRQPLLQHSHS